MIDKFVQAWERNKHTLTFDTHPGSYLDIVKAVVVLLGIAEGDYNSPDPERITEINHGDYQGTLLYIIGAKGYQPSTYWSVFVRYGSCSGCDTLNSIRDDGGRYGDPPNEQQKKDYMTLALHIVQGLKQLEH